MDINTILTGVVAGVSYSLSHFLKKPQEQKFDIEKFLTTAAIGAVTGVAVALFNLPVAMAYQYVLALGIVPIAENLFQIVKRKIVTKFFSNQA